MRKKEDIDFAIEKILKWQEHEDKRQERNLWIKVRCMSVGGFVIAGMYQFGYWAVVNFKPLRAAVEAFIAVKYGQ